MTGDKRPVFVVGEQSEPRCFKNVKHLPVRYESNKPAYMTDDIFKAFLQEWDNELLFQVGLERLMSRLKCYMYLHSRFS